MLEDIALIVDVHDAEQERRIELRQVEKYGNRNTREEKTKRRGNQEIFEG